MRQLLILVTTMMSISALSVGAAVESSEDGVENLVVLLTDYGTTDFYVGALEGSIYSTNLDARISTITHEVPAFNVAEGSYILVQAAREYPPGSVFVAEVDPGIGTRERSIVLETNDDKLFVGPDNGLFTGVMDELGVASIHEITNLNLTRQGRTSAISNGRDIYGPVAGHLAARTDPSEVGPEILDPVRIEVVEADLQNGTLIGTIVHVDHWGHLITNIPHGLIETAGLVPGDRVEVVVGGETKEALIGTTYNDVSPGEWVVMTGLSGQLVISKNMYSAADTLGVSAGAEVRVHEI